LDRRLDGFGFGFPLTNTLLELFDFVLLIASNRGLFSPSSTSQGQLFDFISKLLAFREHRWQLGIFIVGRSDCGSSRTQLSNHIDQGYPIQSAGELVEFIGCGRIV
jgi:hypothetical protein